MPNYVSLFLIVTIWDCLATVQKLLSILHKDLVFSVLLLENKIGFRGIQISFFSSEQVEELNVKLIVTLSAWTPAHDQLNLELT